MDGTYEIMLGSEPIGEAVVERQGLYYSFSCRCRLSGAVLYRVDVCCDGHHEDLGILIPMGDRFGLTTKVPAKRLRKGTLRFQALPKHRKLEGQFVPVYPEEPFAYLTRLQDAFLAVRDGQVGVVIRESSC